MLIVCGFPIVLFGWLFYSAIAIKNTLQTVFWGCISALFWGVFIFGVIYTPHKYILTSSHLIIKRYFKDIVIPLKTIKSIRLMTPNDKKGMLRTFGAEGAFGSWGYYSTSAHKKLIVVARRYNNRTLIITDRETYVIAPDDLQLIDMTAQQIGQVEIQTPEILFNNWRSRMPAAIAIVTTVAVTVFIYLGYKEPKVEFSSNNFKMKGLYGVNIPFAEIGKADTLTWHEMPAISIRTNGIALFKVSRGHFKTRNGDKVRLSVQRGINPVIRIVKRDGSVFYINRKNADETRQIYDQLRIKN